MSDDISVLGIAVETRGVREGEAALNRLERSGKAAEQSSNKLASQSKTTSTEIASLAKSAAAAGAAFVSMQSISTIAKGLIDAQQAAQKLRNTLEYAAGGVRAAAGELAYLREVTSRLGLDFDTTSTAYAKFAAATKTAGISLSQTKTVFEGVSTASARLGLSAEETQGALLALSQMASKGTVAAEELRGQLGERLPGAFDLAAKAIGVTTSELNKMLQDGKVIASDFLPKFGQALKDNFTAPVSSLTQELNRLNSAWSLWKQELSDGANGSGFKWITDGLKESAAAMRALGNEASITRRLLVAIGGFEAGAIGVNKFDIKQQQEDAIKSLGEIKKAYVELDRQLSTGMVGKRAYSQRVEALKQEEEEIRDTITRLAVAVGKADGIKIPDIKGEWLAQQKKIDQQINAYINDTSNAPKSVKLASEIEKENTAFNTAIAGLAETDEKYIKALEAHNLRVAEIKKKAYSGSSGAKNDESQYYASQIAAEKDFTATQVALVKARIDQRVISEESGIKEILDIQNSGFEKQAKLLEEQLSKTKDAGDKSRIEQQIKFIGNSAAEAAARYEAAISKIVSARESAENSRIFDQIETQQGQAAAIEEANRALREQTEEIGLNDQQLLALQQSRIDDQISIEQWKLSLIGGTEAEGQMADAIRETISALEDRKAAIEGRTIANMAKKAVNDWEKASNKIGDSITDALMRGFESGKGFAENLKDTVVNMFKTMVLQPTIKATVVSGMSALGFGSNSSYAADGSSGGGSSGNSLVSTGMSLYNNWDLLSQWGSGSMSTANAYGTYLANATNTGIDGLLATNGAYGTAGSSGGLSTLGSVGSTIGGMAAGYTLGQQYGVGAGLAGGLGTTAISGGLASMAAGGTFAAGMMAIPVYGWIAAAIAAIAGSMAKGGTPHAGGIVYSDGTNVTNPNSRAEIISYYSDYKQSDNMQESDWTKRYNQSISDALEPTATGIAEILNSASGVFGDGGKYTVGLAFSSDGEDKSRGRYSIVDDTGNEVFDWGRKKFDTDAEDGIEEFINATGRGIVSVLEQMDLPEWAAGLLDDLGDKATLEEASALVEQMKAIQTAAEKMSPALEMTADNFAEIYLKAGDAAMSAYYSLVATSSEQLSDSYRVVSDAFDDLGVAIPDSIDGFRDLITSLDETSDEGQETIASLFQLASAFGTVQQAIANLKSGVADATYELRSPQEQAAIQAEKLADAAKEAGVAIPSSVEELLRLADSIDYTTLAGIQLATAMPALAAAFTAAQQAAAAAATNPYTIDTIQSDASDAVDAAFSALESAVEREKEAITSQYEAQSAAWDSAVEAAENVKASLESLAETLRNAVDTTAIQSDSLTLSRRASAQNDLNIALAAAMRGQTLTGYTDSITKAISTFSDNSATDLYSSFEDYARAQGRANASIAALADQADLQVTAQDKQIAAIEKAGANAASYYETQIGQLDQVLLDAQAQIDALNGIDTSVMTVAQAIAALSSAIANMAAINTATGTDNRSTGSASQTVTQAYADILGRTPETQGYEYWVSQMMGGASADQITSAIASSTEAQNKINDLYEDLLNRNAESEGMAYWTHQLELGQSLAEIAAAIKASPEYKNSHASGLVSVPYDGYQATLHRDETVVDAQSTAVIRRYFASGFNAAPNTSAANDEIAALRSEQRAQSGAIAGLMNRVARVLEKWEGDGMPEVRSYA